MAERLTEEQIEKILEWGVEFDLCVQALRQLRGDLEVTTDFATTGWLECYTALEEADATLNSLDQARADLQTVTIMCGEAIRERDAARAQVQALREALQAEHQPHAEWVGCPTCAALAVSGEEGK